LTTGVIEDLCEFLEKFEKTALMGSLGAWGKTDSCKKPDV
jgi:hypothetical protein